MRRRIPGEVFLASDAQCHPCPSTYHTGVTVKQRQRVVWRQTNCPIRRYPLAEDPPSRPGILCCRVFDTTPERKFPKNPRNLQDIQIEVTRSGSGRFRTATGRPPEILFLRNSVTQGRIVVQRFVGDCTYI
jgi:hypothetical protein